MMSSSSLRTTLRKVPALVRKGLPMVTKRSENEYASTGKWILGTGGLVVGMIHVGGVTRLTQSGLSMTSWSPLGSLPPITAEEWEKEFERYKQSPEFEQRKSMTVREFQFIYAWEYGHRMLGRVVGICFAVPWAYFTVRGRIPPGYQKRMMGLFAMGGTQGLVGWWMVKSGLGEDRRGDRHEIRVKPVRLMAHLMMAVTTYGALLWTGLDLLGLPHQQNRLSTSRIVSEWTEAALRQAGRLRAGSLVLSGITALTIASGALVAGNDAGRAYNSFPKMGDHWIPPEVGGLSPLSHDLVANTATVQFNHRVLGISTALTALSLSGIGLTRPTRILTPQARNGLYIVGIAATAQMGLGIATLLQYVPLHLAATHQIGSIVVFTSSVYLAHSLRYAAPAVVRASQKALKSPRVTLN